jgi:hypothetical protein
MMVFGCTASTALDSASASNTSDHRFAAKSAQRFSPLLCSRCTDDLMPSTTEKWNQLLADRARRTGNKNLVVHLFLPLR